MAKVILLLQLILFEYSLLNYTSYKDYVVFEVIPRNHSDVELLACFEDNDHFDFWSSIRSFNYPVSIMVDPQDVMRFTCLMNMRRIQFHVLIRDVDRTIQRERNQMEACQKIPKGKISFKNYHEYSEILTYLKQICFDNPDLVKLEVYGHSYEGKELIAVKIGNGPWTNPTIFIDSGFHGREWIATAASLYIIKQLVENKKNFEMVHNVNWVIIPITNPDGYEYSHKMDRLWRKTRSPNRLCNGVDPYRNFDYQWSSSNGEDECSGSFPGCEPFSEVETKAFRDFALGSENIVLYITLHSPGKWIIYPWCTTTQPPNNWKELQTLGENVAKAIKIVNGTEYVVGTQPDLAKPASGTSKDWMMGVVGIRLCYAIEIAGGECLGFDPPINKILTVCNETWAGIKEFYNYIVQDILLIES